MRKLTMAATAAASIALALGTATSASAADTPTTFTLDAGALAITAPASKALGNGAAAGTIGGQLGAVTVTDARATLGGSWTASVSSTNFTNSTEPLAAPVANGSVTYWSGPATASSGTATTVPGQAAAPSAAALGTPATAYSASATTGNNSTTWNPTLTVNVPAQAIAGDYTGTVTHSLA